MTENTTTENVDETTEIADEKVAVTTAFTIIITQDGSPRIVTDVADILTLDRVPTLLDIRRAVLEINSDLDAQAAGSYAVQFLAQAQQQTQQPTQSETISEGLAERGIDLSK